jgi:hypothetical protein
MKIKVKEAGCDGYPLQPTDDIKKKLFLYYNSLLQQFPVNLDFPLCTIPTVRRYEKYGVFGKHLISGA